MFRKALNTEIWNLDGTNSFIQITYRIFHVRTIPYKMFVVEKTQFLHEQTWIQVRSNVVPCVKTFQLFVQCCRDFTGEIVRVKGHLKQNACWTHPFEKTADVREV